jgi:hypothetical protein
MKLTEKDIARMALKTDRNGPIPEWKPELGPCWVWLGAPTSTGYGSVSIGNVTYRAHRVSYQIHIGPIPDGLQLDHVCRNRICVRPSHLEPVTNQENAERSPIACTLQSVQSETRQR